VQRELSFHFFCCSSVGVPGGGLGGGGGGGRLAPFQSGVVLDLVGPVVSGGTGGTGGGTGG